MAASRIISLSEKIIKPSSPTLSHLRNYKLSLLDQGMSSMYIPMAYFYPRPLQPITQLSHILENSLSKTLTSYYPFAGKLKDNISVDCNDIGAKFVNVQLNCSMSEVVNLSDTSPEYLGFPKDVPWSIPKHNSNLLVAQLSQFRCGGIAVSACFSHKLGDACTTINLMNDWSTIARDSNNATRPSPLWTGASIFPPTNNPVSETFAEKIPFIRKRYVFSSSKLSALKEVMTLESGVQNLTRNEVVTALLYKCIRDASRATLGYFKPSELKQVANLRPRLNPPLPPNVAGNIVSMVSIQTTNEEELKYSRLIKELRKGKEELKKKQDGSLLMSDDNSDHQQSNANDVDSYWFTGMCNYPLYNVDFGWGRPERVVVPSGTINSIILSDNREGDGIEALVSLNEQVMPKFHSNKELMQFASPISC